jgi:hypothetical protein
LKPQPPAHAAMTEGSIRSFTLRNSCWYGAWVFVPERLQSRLRSPPSSLGARARDGLPVVSGEAVRGCRDFLHRRLRDPLRSHASTDLSPLRFPQRRPLLDLGFRSSPSPMPSIRGRPGLASGGGSAPGTSAGA